MKLSEFKAQYFPWSKEYKLREKQEAQAREKASREFWESVKKGHMELSKKQAEAQLARAQAAQQQERLKPYTPQPTATINSSSTFGDALLGSLVGNVIGNALSSHSSSSDSDSSSSWSSSSDSSSSWSDSSSSSWSDSGSSSWD